VRSTENAAHNFGQKHLKVWAASVDEGLVTLLYGSDEPFEFLEGEFEKNGPANKSLQPPRHSRAAEPGRTPR